MWCLAELDDEYIEKMEEVLEVYEKPPSAQAPVVCDTCPSLTSLSCAKSASIGDVFLLRFLLPERRLKGSANWGK